MRAFVVTLGLAASLVAPVSTLVAQQGFGRDTVNPFYTRWSDELPALLTSVASVVQFGLDSIERESLRQEFRTLRPLRQREPGTRPEPTRSRTYLLTTGFRGRETRLSMFVYWHDTSVVAVRLRSPDVALDIAIDSAVRARRAALLVKPDQFRVAVSDVEGFEGRPAGVGITLAAGRAAHCPDFDVEKRMRWQADTFIVQVLGVPRVGICPNVAGMRGSGYALHKGPGRYIIAIDSHGDTNIVAMDVTDSTVALTPLRTTFVVADTGVKPRVASGTITLECNRAAGDPRLCDALHEFVLELDGVRAARFARSPAGFDSRRSVSYRYANETIGDKVLRCFASIDPQDRSDAWVHWRVRTTSGTWRSDRPTGHQADSKRRESLTLDGRGGLSPRCGDAGAVLASRDVSRRPRGMPSIPPRITAVSMFAYGAQNPTTIEARSDGWIVMTPLATPRPVEEPYPTTHLFARALDALRWSARVRTVLGAQPDTSAIADPSTFIPSLGRGVVRARMRVSGAMREKTTLTLDECRSVGATYDLERGPALEIAADIERAARIALSASATAVAPDPGRAYLADEVSCRAVPDTANAKPTVPDDLPRGRPRFGNVGVRFIVDTSGRVEPSSITILPAGQSALRAAAQILVAGWRYRRAEWADVPVRQVINTTLTFGTPPLVSAWATGQTKRADIAPLPVRQGGFASVRRYPLRVIAPSSHVPRRAVVVASVAIDTNGVPDARGVVVMPGTDAGVASTLRRHVAEHRFTPALRAGRRVRDTVVRAWIVEPRAECLADDSGPECPRDDAPLPGEVTPPIPSDIRRSEAFYDIRAEVAPMDESDVIPAALGVPNLRETTLAANVREMRVHSGLVIGYPHTSLFIREEGLGGRVTGRLAKYWPASDSGSGINLDTTSIYANSVKGYCDEPRRGPEAIACYVTFNREPDWRAVLRVLDSANAWDLPDESKVPSRGMTIDGWRLRVEVRRGAAYRQYQYHNPQVYRPPDGPNAARVMALVDSLAQLGRAPTDLVYVRGIYVFGRDTSGFVRCGRPEKPGYFAGELAPIGKLLGDSLWKAPPSPSRAFEVTAWVRRRTLPEEKHGTRFYPRTWQVELVTDVRERPSRQCAP